MTWRRPRYITDNSCFNDSGLFKYFITEAVINRTFALMVMHARKPQRISDGYDIVFDGSVLQSVDHCRWRSPIDSFPVITKKKLNNSFLFSGTLRSTKPIRTR